MTRNIVVEIARCQAETMNEIKAGKCTWLLPLVEYWRNTRAVVITLNYDTLVEELAGCLLNSLPVGRRYRNVYPETLMSANTRTGLGTWASYRDDEPTFSLLKLHGSVNWYRSESHDARSDTIYFVEGRSVPTTPIGEPPSIVSDKVPFIVPPVPNKGSLVYHDTIRAMWRDAAQAFKDAERIVVMGYSMPVNDVLFMHLIRSNLFNRKPPIELVDKVDLTQHVTEIFADEGSSIRQEFTGDTCIRDFVEKGAYRRVLK
jgi:hypothetical protein